VAVKRERESDSDGTCEYVALEMFLALGKSVPFCSLDEGLARMREELGISQIRVVSFREGAPLSLWNDVLKEMFDGHDFGSLEEVMECLRLSREADGPEGTATELQESIPPPEINREQLGKLIRTLRERRRKTALRVSEVNEESECGDWEDTCESCGATDCGFLYRGYCGDRD
jgi:hypothetical protein